VTPETLAILATAAAAAFAAGLVAMRRRSRELGARLEREREESRARQAQAAAELERARVVAKALPDGVVILEGNRLEWCNAAAEAQLGVVAARDAGIPITHLVRDPAFDAYLAGGDFSGSIELRRPAAPGRVVVVQLVEGDGRRFLFSHDVSHVRRLEQVGREFVANVSHELRTPLTVVAGFIETLRDEADPAAARRYLDLMAEQSGRMQRLVEDILTLSSLESSPPPPEDPIDMQALAERLGAEARALSKGRHRVEVHLGCELDVVGSERELASALGNLVSNAVRYTPEGGSIRLDWHASGEGGADFDVEDTGIGIAPEHIPRLTERFYRVDRGRSRESGGTGLGLAIVKHALERHGATLHIGSTPGKGSRFSARFSGRRLRPRGA
jgi:two-component system, OmpR family, phosphate regulon sensor histidine kinase PhoR